MVPHCRLFSPTSTVSQDNTPNKITLKVLWGFVSFSQWTLGQQALGHGLVGMFDFLKAEELCTLLHSGSGGWTPAPLDRMEGHTNWFTLAYSLYQWMFISIIYLNKVLRHFNRLMWFHIKKKLQHGAWAQTDLKKLLKAFVSAREREPPLVCCLSYQPLYKDESPDNCPKGASHQPPWTESQGTFQLSLILFSVKRFQSLCTVTREHSCRLESTAKPGAVCQVLAVRQVYSNRRKRIVDQLHATW